jgi:hypothetical protein
MARRYWNVFGARALYKAVLTVRDPRKSVYGPLIA